MQLSRAKEQLEKLTDDRDRKDGVDQRSQDESKRYQRQLRELQEEFVELQRKETEATQRKNELVRVHVTHVSLVEYLGMYENEKKNCF